MYGKRGCNSSRVSSSRPLRPRLGDCFRERMAMPIVGAHQSITAHEIACKAAFEVMAVNPLRRVYGQFPYGLTVRHSSVQWSYTRHRAFGPAPLKFKDLLPTLHEATCSISLFEMCGDPWSHS